jgi:hypothetical protein
MYGLAMNEALEAKRKGGENDSETLICPVCGFHLATVGNYQKRLTLKPREARPLRVAKLNSDMIEHRPGEYIFLAQARPYIQTKEGKAQKKELEQRFALAKAEGDKRAERDAWEKLRVLKCTGARPSSAAIYLTAEKLKPVLCKCGRRVGLTLR